VYLYTEAYDQAKSEDTSAVQGENFMIALRDWSLTGSIGGFAYGSTRFYEANFTSPASLDSSLNNLTGSDPNSISLECQNGQIDALHEYSYYGLILRDFPSAYTFFMFERQFNNDTTFYNMLTACTGQTKCTLNYSASWFTEAATDYIKGTNGKQQHKLYVKYHCANIKLNYFNRSYAKSDLNYVIIIVNFLVLGAFLVYLACWIYYEKSIFAQYTSRTPHPSDYTLKLKNLPQHWNEEELALNLHRHLNQYAKKLNIKGDPIVDINVAKNNSILHLDQLIRKYDIKSTAIVQKFLADGVIENPPQGTPLDIKYFLECRLLNPEKFTEPSIKTQVDNLMKAIKKKQTYLDKRTEFQICLRDLQHQPIQGQILQRDEHHQVQARQPALLR
jgi:hypothetical protein